MECEKEQKSPPKLNKTPKNKAGLMGLAFGLVLGSASQPSSPF